MFMPENCRGFWSGIRSVFRRRAVTAAEPTGQSLVPAPDVQASIHSAGMALLDIATGKVFLCNETGSRIWQGVVMGLSAEDIAEDISREFGVAAELVRRDTSLFVGELERRRLVVRTAEV
jgi:hypothetical protein